MRLRPHLGTLLFPPVALLYLSNLSAWRSDEVFLCLVVALCVFAVLAIMSWRFLRRYPTVGVFYSACLVMTFPLTQNYTSEDLLQVLLGSTSVVGMVGVIYFAVRGIRAGTADRAEARGFPVIPEARRADDVGPPR